VDQLFDRFERMFKSWVAGAAESAEDLLGSGRGFQGPGGGPRRSSGDPDLDAAMDELDDFLDMGRTETEARERERARREREEAARRRAGSPYSGGRAGRPGPPEALIKAYRTLGLSYGVPFPEVKAAYKRLLMQNHPDRNSATPEQLKRSTEISAMINEAYNKIETWNSKGRLDDT
jgi:hypothetical protein